MTDHIRHTEPTTGVEVYLTPDTWRDLLKVTLRRQPRHGHTAATYAHPVRHGDTMTSLTEWLEAPETGEAYTGGPIPGIAFREDDARALYAALGLLYGDPQEVATLKADAEKWKALQAVTARELAEADRRATLAEQEAVNWCAELGRVEGHLATMTEFRDFAQAVGTRLEALLTPAQWALPEQTGGPEEFAMWTVDGKDGPTKLAEAIQDAITAGRRTATESEPRTFTDPQGDVWTYDKGWRITECPHVTDVCPLGQHLETSALRPMTQLVNGQPRVGVHDDIQRYALLRALEALKDARVKGWTRHHDLEHAEAADGADHLARLVLDRIDRLRCRANWPVIAGLALAALERDRAAELAVEECDPDNPECRCEECITAASDLADTTTQA